MSKTKSDLQQDQTQNDLQQNQTNQNQARQNQTNKNQTNQNQVKQDQTKQDCAQHDNWQEQQHLAECLELIQRNIAYYEKEAAQRKEETTQLMQAMKTGDPELYNQAMTAASLETHATNQLRKNKASLRQPYFGRF